MKIMHARALFGLIFLAVVMAPLLFIPAGTVHYWQAWVYLLLFFGIAAFITLYLMIKDPALLARRLNAGPAAEKEPKEKIIMSFTSLGFISLLVVPALDRRFGWSSMPVFLVITGDTLTVLGFAIVFRVFRENPFAFATIEVARDQKVISTGPYAIVRHPMYTGGVMYLLGMPLALGSYWGFIAFAAMLPFLIWRIYDEEDVLSRKLCGYVEYRAKVQWRLIPGIF